MADSVDMRMVANEAAEKHGQAFNIALALSNGDLASAVFLVLGMTAASALTPSQDDPTVLDQATFMRLARQAFENARVTIKNRG